MTMTDERLAELDAVMAKATAVMRAHEVFLLTHDLDMHGSCPDEALDEIAGEVDAAQRDLRAHIDEQAATIARQAEALRTAEAFIPDHGEGVGHTDLDCPCGEASARRKARAALAGAA